MHIRDVKANDLPEIQSIINYYRMNSFYLWDRTPLQAEDMCAWLSDHTTPPYAALVAEQEGKVVGYTSLSRFRPYSGYDPTAENSIYLAPEHIGSGTGTALMEALLQRARKNGLKVVTAWIDSGNASSIRFHEKMGFTYAGELKRVGILDGIRTSVTIMQIDLDEPLGSIYSESYV